MTSQKLKDRTKAFAKGCLQFLVSEGRNHNTLWLYAKQSK